MPILKGRLATLKAMGYRAGINHLCTVGQADEDLASAAVVPGAQYFTNWRGEIAKSNRCENDPVWREKWIKPVYKALAETGPDFIWMDDDLRLLNHGVKGTGCFCPVCMARIRERLGYTGEDVKGLGAFFADPQKGETRRLAMLQLNRETHVSLFTFIRDVVRSIDPKIVLGVMDAGGPRYDGNGYVDYINALAPHGEEVFFRPGAGFYTDQFGVDGILSKANSLAFEAVRIPDTVRCVESEIETFNYQVIGKSTHTLKMEALVYLAAGVRGTAWNVMPYAANDAIAPFARRLKALEAIRSEADAIVAAAGSARPCGVWDGTSENSFAGNRAAGREGAWLDYRVLSGFLGSDLQKIGIPVAYRESEADICAPTSDTVWSWTSEELKRRLAGALFLDVGALKALIDRGHGSDTGFSIGKSFRLDARERYVEHPINQESYGFERDVRQSFWGGPAYELKPHPGAQITGQLVDMRGKEFAPCCSGVFENKFGGRIYASGYFPYSRIGFTPTIRHYHRVFDWLAREGMSGRVDSIHRTAMFVRGSRLVSVFNMTYDTAEDVEILLRGAAWRNGIRSLSDVGNVIKGVPEGVYTRYRLNAAVPAWSLAGFVPVDVK